MPPRTRAQQLAQDIERFIAQRGLTEGDALGTLESWREESGYARSTVSEAMRLMIDRGHVEIRPGRGGGIFVARANAVVRLRHTLLSVPEEPATVADAIAIRDALEYLVDSDAAEHRTDADIADLRERLSALGDASGDTDAFMRANWALHERIAQISPNLMLKAMYVSMTNIIAELSAHADPDESDTADHYVQRRFEVHRRLVEAIILGDRDAVREAVARHAE